VKTSFGWKPFHQLTFSRHIFWLKTFCRPIFVRHIFWPQTFLPPDIWSTHLWNEKHITDRHFINTSSVEKSFDQTYIWSTHFLAKKPFHRLTFSQHIFWLKNKHFTNLYLFDTFLGHKPFCHPTFGRHVFEMKNISPTGIWSTHPQSQNLLAKLIFGQHIFLAKNLFTEWHLVDTSFS
jgi:hypothetical protein